MGTVALVGNADEEAFVGIGSEIEEEASVEEIADPVDVAKTEEVA